MDNVLSAAPGPSQASPRALTGRGLRKERYPLNAIITRHIRRPGAKAARNRPETARNALLYSKNPQRSGKHPYDDVLRRAFAEASGGAVRDIEVSR